VGEQLSKPSQILFGHHAGRAQLTLTLARFLGEDMATVRLASLKSVGSLAKTFRRCPLSLQLRHFKTPNFISLFSELEITSNVL
jgi:hypothetical protein